MLTQLANNQDARQGVPSDRLHSLPRLNLMRQRKLVRDWKLRFSSMCDRRPRSPHRHAQAGQYGVDDGSGRIVRPRGWSDYRRLTRLSPVSGDREAHELRELNQFREFNLEGVLSLVALRSLEDSFVCAK